MAAVIPSLFPFSCHITCHVVFLLFTSDELTHQPTNGTPANGFTSALLERGARDGEDFEFPYTISQPPARRKPAEDHSSSSNSVDLL